VGIIEETRASMIRTLQLGDTRRERLYLTDIVEAADHIAEFIAGADFQKAVKYVAFPRERKTIS
jgi:hypothetical protein